MKKSYRQMTKQERRECDAFYGGVCTTLSAAFGTVGEDGTSTYYLEAVAVHDAGELLGFARRNQDMELPRIRRAVRYLKREQDSK